MSVYVEPELILVLIGPERERVFMEVILVSMGTDGIEYRERERESESKRESESEKERESEREISDLALRCNDVVKELLKRGFPQ